MAKAGIVIFSALYMPHLGGVEKFSQSIAAELSKDHQVTVFCMNTEKQPATIMEGNAEVHFLPCFPVLKGRFPIPKLSALFILHDWFSRNSVDFAIVQCRFYLLSLLGCRICSKHHIPFIQIEHGAGEIVMPNPVVDRIWHCYDRILTRLEQRIPHDYYAVSEAGLRWLEANYGIRGLGVISNSAAPEDFSAALSDPGAWKREKGLPSDAVIITFTGRIMSEKGVTDLLNAFDRLHGENLYLVIAGGGDMKLIQPWADRKNILFTGQIPFEEVPRLLTDTDIYCLPSHFIEGKPTGVLEAGLCGNAVVVTGSGGSVEIVPDERYGRLIPSGDVDKLTETLQDLADHPEERAEIGENLRQRVLEFFTWKTAAAKIRDAMRKYGL